MTGRDMNAQVAEYRGLCESLASRFARPGQIARNGVEWDDLVQEGLISVWNALKEGKTPSSDYLLKRMQTYARDMGAQKRGGTTEFKPLEENDDTEAGREV